MASSCAGEDSRWMLGRISSLKEWPSAETSCPGMWLSEVFMKHLNVVLRDMVFWGYISGRWIVRLDDLGYLFQSW